jgi:hypothetical protein
MLTEKLTLEVQAVKLGWKVIKPPVIAGRSGVDHAFSFVASTGTINYAFDIYEEVSEMEVLKSFIKKFDTGSVVNIICATGKVGPSAEKMAKEYDIRIFDATNASQFFQVFLIARPNGAAPNA